MTIDTFALVRRAFRCQIIGLVAAAAAALLLLTGASASTIVARNASGVTLAVGADGMASIGFVADGTPHHVLAWGAVDALPPSRGRPQVAFRLDYSGGWSLRKPDLWKQLENACAPYDGPRLAWFVTGCRAPDGTYWALQRWQRMLPNYGLEATKAQAVWELHLSHWSGQIPAFDVHADWTFRGRIEHLYGTLTYRGSGVFGFASTPQGVPLDSYGRNVYLDTLDSAYGAGWLRENSFLVHRAGGSFCYGFFEHGARPGGAGTRYRATVIGPGVLPDVYWEGSAPGPYDVVLDILANRAQDRLRDQLCRGS